MTIRPNLRAWLDATPPEYLENDRRNREFIRKSGSDWPQNVARHSFVSYALAATENAARVALESGHTEAVLFSTYRETVTPEKAAEYFAIYPPGRKEPRPGPQNPERG